MRVSLLQTSKDFLSCSFVFGFCLNSFFPSVHTLLTSDGQELVLSLYRPRFNESSINFFQMKKRLRFFSDWSWHLQTFKLTLSSCFILNDWQTGWQAQWEIIFSMYINSLPFQRSPFSGIECHFCSLCGVSFPQQGKYKKRKNKTL